MNSRHGPLVIHQEDNILIFGYSKEILEAVIGGRPLCEQREKTNEEKFQQIEHMLDDPFYTTLSLVTSSQTGAALLDQIIHEGKETLESKKERKRKLLLSTNIEHSASPPTSSEVGDNGSQGKKRKRRKKR